MENIALLGYMGSGKSTIAKILAQKLSLKSLDLDQLIEEQEDLSVTQIFESKGEIYFRKKEHEVLKATLASNHGCVLALGGGTPCYAGNGELLERSGWKTVYLRASIGTIINRISESDSRPLIRDKSHDELRDFVAMHLFERSFFYNQAEVIISVDDKSPEEIANLIMDNLT